jgi:hypothetical protein
MSSSLIEEYTRLSAGVASQLRRMDEIVESLSRGSPQKYKVIIEDDEIYTSVKITNDGEDIDLSELDEDYIKYLIDFAETGRAKPYRHRADDITSAWKTLSEHPNISASFIETITPIVKSMIGKKCPETVNLVQTGNALYDGVFDELGEISYIIRDVVKHLHKSGSDNSHMTDMIYELIPVFKLFKAA